MEKNLKFYWQTEIGILHKNINCYVYLIFNICNYLECLTEQ